jgi:hypothetical protein
MAAGRIHVCTFPQCLPPSLEESSSCGSRSTPDPMQFGQLKRREFTTLLAERLLRDLRGTQIHCSTRRASDIRMVKRGGGEDYADRS